MRAIFEIEVKVSFSQFPHSNSQDALVKDSTIFEGHFFSFADIVVRRLDDTPPPFVRWSPVYTFFNNAALLHQNKFQNYIGYLTVYSVFQIQISGIWKIYIVNMKNR